MAAELTSIRNVFDSENKNLDPPLPLDGVDMLLVDWINYNRVKVFP